MNQSWRMTRLSGIDLHVHWTLVALVGWTVLTGTLRHGPARGFQELALACSLFACVVLHELGHALAARHFGIGTHDITLLPIGGVASLERIPRNPWQELVIALAGPAVNALLLIPLVPAWLFWQQAGLAEQPSLPLATTLLHRLVAVNLMLILFNLIPAFPMDGGRVLRATLALRDAYVNATRRAVSVGKIAALGLMCLGLFANPLLILIGLFVMISGEAEYQHVLREQIRGDAGGSQRGEASRSKWRSVNDPPASDDAEFAGSSTAAASSANGGRYPRQELIIDPAWPASQADQRGVFRFGRRSTGRTRPASTGNQGRSPFDYRASGPSCA